MTKGTDLITTERQRQIEVEGYDAEHDRDESVALALAGATYAIPSTLRQVDAEGPLMWPWELRYWKPTPADRIRELTKAGALIAAAIDSLSDPEP